jgi:hypothetical protein
MWASSEEGAPPEMKLVNGPLERVSGVLCPAEAELDYWYTALDNFSITS